MYLSQKFSSKSRKYCSYRGKVGVVAPNIIKREFNISIPHHKIATDTTEFKYYVKEKSRNTQIKNYT